jgi:hypothetical protein
MVCAEHTIGLEITLDTRWYSYERWVKWKLVSVHLDIVLISALGGCTVYAKGIIGSEIIFDTLDCSPR